MWVAFYFGLRGPLVWFDLIWFDFGLTFPQVFVEEDSNASEAV